MGPRFVWRCALCVAIVSLMLTSASAQVELDPDGMGAWPPPPDRGWPKETASPTTLPRPLFQADPIILELFNLTVGFESGTVTDVAAADFDGDGIRDIAIAWYANPAVPGSPESVRRLTILFGTGGLEFERVVDIDLFEYNDVIPALSVFLLGTADIAIGDFDGDDDPDLMVTPFFGDEIWFIENLGERNFAPYLRFVFGINQPANFDTPPEGLVGDFDGDGRDELAYLADASLQIDGTWIHFWETDTNIAAMHRVYWEADGGVHSVYRRGLAVADFDGDGRADLCFSGGSGIGFEDPVLTFWYDLSGGRFDVHTEAPGFLCADVVGVQIGNDRPGVIVTDIDGTAMEFWRNDEAVTGLAFSLAGVVEGYAGISPDRGMSGAMADIDGDGDPDLITKQKLGGVNDANQIELTRYDQSHRRWERVDPTPLNSLGLQNDADNQILRPHNLTALDLIGNTLPEIVAGFGVIPTGIDSAGPNSLLASAKRKIGIAIWLNSTPGDVTRDGRTDFADLDAVMLILGACAGEADFDADADLNKNGCIDRPDVELVRQDLP